MGPTGDTVNVIQIHPTRRCNLRCQHCYSTSGPEVTSELPVEWIEAFLADAAAEGFNAIGLSGGEPLVYRPLPRLLAYARSLGYYTTVTTNGLLLDERHLAAIGPHVSLVAISIDGVPEQHDRMRAMPRAFDRMRARLDLLRKTGLPFGFIFTLTLNNLDELAWVAEFAAGEGAALLQVHPLEQVGRARDYALLPPDDLELAYAFVEVARLQKEYGQRLRIQFDVADRPLIEREPYRAFAIATPDPAISREQPLAALVSPLVLQDDGLVVPVQHGFGRSFAIADLADGRFASQASTWKRQRYPAFLDVARRVWDDLQAAPAHLPFTNWYAAITSASQDRPPPTVDPPSAVLSAA
ncbi:radical SAM protein [Tahibacter amnicola]|uniref:Radical SAM protein n=1 Tax=Tahibacter amnicola TaxID=2976241 RepID=A0ABY6BJJ2_9GAMM|nr:radical SAM protein [Tahibacter amnicola]UXI70049.1 radical SAM protein [Tahibacter amnicola]